MRATTLTYQLNHSMNKTPLAVFSGLVVAAAAASGYFAISHAWTSAPQEAPAAQQVSAAKPDPAPAPQVAVVAPPAPVETAKPAPSIVPSFDTARVDAAGNAIVAGRAAPQSDVKLMWNGAVIATAKANEAGEFVIMPEKPLPVGAGNLALEASLNGTATPSAQKVPVAVKSAATTQTPTPAPAPVTVVAAAELPKATPELVKPLPVAAGVDGIAYDQSGSIQFSGHAHPGSAVHLFVDNKPAAEVKADDAGKWTYADAASIPAGTHDLRADEIDAGGSVAARVTLPFKREDTATVATAQAAAGAASGQAAQALAPHSVTIQPGNTLWRLARDIYGAGRNYTVIFQANKSQIKTPRLIYPGQILSTPEKSGN